MIFSVPADWVSGVGKTKKQTLEKLLHDDFKTLCRGRLTPVDRERRKPHEAV